MTEADRRELIRSTMQSEGLRLLRRLSREHAKRAILEGATLPIPMAPELLERFAAEIASELNEALVVHLGGRDLGPVVVRVVHTEGTKAALELGGPLFAQVDADDFGGAPALCACGTASAPGGSGRCYPCWERATE